MVGANIVLIRAFLDQEAMREMQRIKDSVTS
jgi:hypothetical protein